MLSEGREWPSERSWPEGSQTFEAAEKRLARICLWLVRFELGSYHATQGTVRPAPAKSIDGASATTVGSRLSEAGNPCVTHAPPLKARTKICRDEPLFCSNAAHGTCRLPATTVPPWTSETPASWLGSMPFAGSLLTCEPSAGRPTNAAAAVPARTSVAAVATAASRPRRLILMVPP
jgi:hypothetical protein